MLATIAAPGLAPHQPAQISEYFVMAGDQARFQANQNGVLLRSWSPAAGTAQYQYPLVVTGGSGRWGPTPTRSAPSTT